MKPFTSESHHSWPQLWNHKHLYKDVAAIAPQKAIIQILDGFLLIISHPLKNVLPSIAHQHEMNAI